MIRTEDGENNRQSYWSQLDQIQPLVEQRLWRCSPQHNLMIDAFSSAWRTDQSLPRTSLAHGWHRWLETRGVCKPSRRQILNSAPSVTETNIDIRRGALLLSSNKNQPFSHRKPVNKAARWGFISPSFKAIILSEWIYRCQTAIIPFVRNIPRNCAFVPAFSIFMLSKYKRRNESLASLIKYGWAEMIDSWCILQVVAWVLLGWG